MKTQKWMFVGTIIILLGAAALVAFTIFTPFARAQGPLGWGGHGDGPGFGQGMHGLMGGRWGGPENSMLTVIAETLGITPEELRSELQAGKTIAEVAAEKNVAVETLVEAVVVDRTEQLDEMVTNGQITQAEADAMLTLMKANLTRRINEGGVGRGFGRGMLDGSMEPGFGKGPGGGRGGFMGGRGGGPENAPVQVVADALGLTPVELMTALQEGKTVVEVAAEQNVDVDTLVETILAPRTQRLNELVTAGQLSQAEVDAKLTILRVDVIERLNQRWGSPANGPQEAPGESETN